MRPIEAYQAIFGNISCVIKGQEKNIRKLLAAFFSGGHVLIEDLPGTGKTTLAKALARSVRGKFQRIQFTPDLLPSDILGVSLYDKQTQDFHFQQGPVFCDILLADEINRASPRTQSALLEAMAENQVSIDGKTRPLNDMFFVIATQNPIEFHGTYPLPEAQLDRFCMQLHLGYVSAEQEIKIIGEHSGHNPLQELQPCIEAGQLTQLRRHCTEIRVSTELKRYIVQLVHATRIATGIRYGASPRASLALTCVSQALAAFDGLDYVSPDQVQEAAYAVLVHRLIWEPQSTSFSDCAEVLHEIIGSVSAPV